MVISAPSFDAVASTILTASFRIFGSPVSNLQTVIPHAPLAIRSRSSLFGFRKVLSFVRSGLIFCLNIVDRVRVRCAFVVHPLTLVFQGCKDIELCFINFTMFCYFTFTYSMPSIRKSADSKCKSSTLDFTSGIKMECSANGVKPLETHTLFLTSAR